VHVGSLGLAALVLSLLSAALIVGFLVRSPPLTAYAKLLLGLGLFVLPTSAALLANVQNLETSKSVEFCGSCHVMDSYVNDARDPSSKSLASLHARLPAFRDEACYTCHADYGMYGGVTTKIGGMHHVVAFYSDDWTRPGHAPPALYKPFDVRTCETCHQPLRDGAPLEHQVHAAKIAAHEISCAAGGCHGPPHPPWVQAVTQ
jgi:cytochrome c-type protein NapC